MFAGFGHEDEEATVAWMSEKILKLRIFEDDTGKMNRSVEDVGGGILVVSQFTLYGDAVQGNRPSFTAASPPGRANVLYEELVRALKARTRLPVETGSFRVEMEVELVNDGPVTIILEK